MDLDLSISCEPVDGLISSEEVYDLDPGARAALLADLAPPFLEDHTEASAEYARWVSFRGSIDPRDPSSFPSIPTTAFKAAPLLSVAPEEVVKWCVSSGTLGVTSRVGRDRLTLDRLLGSVRAGLSLIQPWHEEELQVLHLGPSNDEAGDVWFPYVMSLTELLYPTLHLTLDGRFRPQLAVELLGDLVASGKHIGIIGAPFAVLQLCEALQASPAPLCCGASATVVTGGGWKRHAGAAIQKAEFRHLVTQALGLDGESQVRDAFNQVELNSVFFECTHHRMHVPPWVHAFCRSPSDLEPLPTGATGLLSYVDFSVSSYPCFIVGDDLGKVEDGPCPCGLPGPLLEVHRRIDRGFQRGCALALDKLQEEAHDQRS